MDSRISYFQAKALQVRQMAQVATIERIRAELLKIADQYDGMAATIRGEGAGKMLLRDVTVITVRQKRLQ